MGLNETMKELKEKIAEAEEKEKEQPAVEENLEAEVPAEDEENPEAEDVKEEEVKEEEKPEEELSASDHRKRRRENKLQRDKEALENKVRELEERLLASKDTKETADKPEVQTIELPEEVIELTEERKYLKAGQEFTQMEQDFKKSAPEDFDDVSLQYKAALYHGNRARHPRLSHDQLLEMTNKELLQRAGAYLRDGYDPIEELYQDAKAMGFKRMPKQEAEQAVEEKEDIKPDMNKVAANRARNAGMAAAKGNAGNPRLTRETAAAMSVAEWSKLPKAEKDRLLAGR